jgi:hypothetical protein
MSLQKINLNITLKFKKFGNITFEKTQGKNNTTDISNAGSSFALLT